MALLALGGISVLVIALIVTFICLGSDASAGHAAPPVMPPFGTHVDMANKQDANTPVPVMGVHQIASPAGCWPGVWVGPSPAPQAYPGVAAGRAPAQRRHPSGFAARATSHGALR